MVWIICTCCTETDDRHFNKANPETVFPDCMTGLGISPKAPIFIGYLSVFAEKSFVPLNASWQPGSQPSIAARAPIFSGPALRYMMGI
jgi:hypothetical protein